MATGREAPLPRTPPADHLTSGSVGSQRRWTPRGRRSPRGPRTTSPSRSSPCPTRTSDSDSCSWGADSDSLGSIHTRLHLCLFVCILFLFTFGNNSKTIGENNRTSKNLWFLIERLAALTSSQNLGPTKNHLKIRLGADLGQGFCSMCFFVRDWK